MWSRIVSLLRRAWDALPSAVVWRCYHVWRYDRGHGVKQDAHGRFRVGAKCMKCGKCGKFSLTVERP